jgi:hypothetical protein
VIFLTLVVEGSCASSERISPRKPEHPTTFFGFAGWFDS